MRLRLFLEETVFINGEWEEEGRLSSSVVVEGPLSEIFEEGIFLLPVRENTRNVIVRVEASGLLELLTLLEEVRENEMVARVEVLENEHLETVWIRGE